MQMAVPIAHELKVAESGFETYDVYLNRKVVVKAPVLLISADNVRHAELLNHMGSKANKFCRMCMVSVLHVHVCRTIVSMYDCVVPVYSF